MTAERLSLSVEVTAGGTSATLRGADVRRIALSLTSYGFSGEVELAIEDDERQGGQKKDRLRELFLKPDLMALTLSVQAVLRDGEVPSRVTPLTVRGLVSERELVEDPAPLRGSPILTRRYTLRFEDPASLLWRQHHPVVLHARCSLRDVIEKERGPQLTLRYDWSLIEAAGPFWCLALTPDPEFGSGASFYDFVMWQVDSRGGTLTYDFRKRDYLLSEKKPALADPIAIAARDLASVRSAHAKVPRHSVEMCNVDASHEGKQRSSISSTTSVDKVRHDYLIRTPIPARFSGHVARQRGRMRSPQWEHSLQLRRFPLTPFYPNDGVDLKPIRPADSLAAKDSPLRAYKVDLWAEILGEEDAASHSPADAAYRFELSAQLERPTDSTLRLPDYRVPRYPLHVEGFVMSGIGTDKELTYQFHADEQTSQEWYRVKLPLFEEQWVPVPFQPDHLSGHFYVPAYKDTRVLLALGLRDAEYVRHLDWRTGARMAQDTQGDRILLGKKQEDGTALSHHYDENQPVFEILRSHGKDTQLLQISEGKLLIRVQEQAQGQAQDQES